MNIEDSPISSLAWSALRGAYDLHVHVAPDVIDRKIDDIDLAKNFLDHGLGGFVLKSHYVPTFERAKVVSKAVHGISVFGSIALNWSVGGLNPLLVDIAGRSGNKIVWMPTLDSKNEQLVQKSKRNAKAPFWAQIQHQVQQKGLLPPPISVLNSSGQLSKEVQTCLELIAEYDMVLATGHLGRDEIFELIPAAKKAGIRRIVVTHALYPSQNLSPQDQRKLSEMGAFIEHCFSNIYTGKVSLDDVLRSIRVVGPEQSLLTTDLGQMVNPSITLGFAAFVQMLLNENLSFDKVRTMSQRNSRVLME